MSESPTALRWAKEVEEPEIHPRRALLREWRRDWEFVAAHDAEGSPRRWERRRPRSPSWRSGETMPSTSTLSASPRRPVPACGFGLSRRSRASPRRKPADHRMKTSRSRSRRRRKRRKFRPTWSSRGSEASFASKLRNEKTLIFQWPIFVTKILVLGEGSREPTFDGPSEGRLVNCYDVSSVVIVPMRLVPSRNGL